MSERTRTLISRGTLLIIAIALLYSGVFCIGKSRELYHDEVRRHAAQPNRSARMNGGFMFIGAVGVILCAGGVLAGLGAVAPTSFIERCLGRPANTKLHEHPEPWPIDLID